MDAIRVSIKSVKDSAYKCDALILPFPEGKPPTGTDLSPALSRRIRRLFSKDFRGKQNELLLLPALDEGGPERVLLVGLGEERDITPERIRQAGGSAARHLGHLSLRRIALSTGFFSSRGLSPAAFVEGALLSLYDFTKYVDHPDKISIRSMAVLSKKTPRLEAEIQWLQVVASSVSFARDLINTPANDMTPSHLVREARSLAQKNLSVTVLERRRAEKLGMGCYLSVAKGSKEPPKFILLDYRGASDPPIVLIGKSVTFDSGGISLKPAEGMEKMKYDMAGGAAVLGIFRALSKTRLPVHVIGMLPATENLIGASATRPGDVVKSLNGKTVEIISTDAEGRMTLADAIAYASTFTPRAIIDIATLTGACSVAFGSDAIAMMGNNRELLDNMKRSGDNVYERVWEMPLFEEYREYLKSDIADLKNTGGKSGSLVSSAFFLSEFAGNVPWVHLDIAGTAWLQKERPYAPKGASGVGVRLILDLMKEFK